MIIQLYQSGMINLKFVLISWSSTYQSFQKNIWIEFFIDYAKIVVEFITMYKFHWFQNNQTEIFEQSMFFFYNNK